MEGNAAQTERIRKMRQKGLLAVEPTSTHVPIEDSETQSEDITRYVAKRKRDAEEENVISKRTQKRVRKSSAKREKLTKQRSSAKGKRVRKHVNKQPLMGPGLRVQNQSEEEEMTREERIEKMEHQKVLTCKVFDTDIITKFGMATLFDAVTIQGWNHLSEPPAPYLHEPEVCEFFYKMKLLEGGGITTTVRDVEICLDKETLGIILGVAVVGIITIEGCKPTEELTKLATK